MSSFKFLHSVAAIVLSAALITTASAQTTGAKVSVDSPKFDDLPSPELGGTKNKSFRQKDWLEVEVKFRIDKVLPEPKDGYVDSIDVKWFLVVKGQDRKNYRIEKTVKHVNIPMNEDIYASVYLSPNTLKRITGKDSASKSDLKAIGGEIHFDGKMARGGSFSHGEREGWWTKTSKSVTATTKFPLLNKDETPFKLYWYDRYAEIAKEK